VEKGHKIIPSASLIPENDPTTLFISAGMHPLVPYLLGEPHPLGKRLASVQKCLRTVDIDEVGDTCHQTFFEMMGNWSLGDYWKEEMIPWSYEFMTKVMGIPAEKISVTCFAGDQDAPQDEETAKLWEKVGIPKERIYFLGKADNWWGPAGKTGPCGPDSEMYYDTGKEACDPDCRPSCNCGKYLEFWNDVFMQYNCTAEGRFEPLKQRNIDTGMGVERMLMVLNNEYDAYRTDVLWPIIQQIGKISGKSYEDEENQKPMRVIADHLRAATFVIADGVIPANVEQGYVLRRLIRRAVRFGKMLGIEKPFTTEVAESVI
jgi:alanyl-tRNA synthetase